MTSSLKSRFESLTPRQKEVCQQVVQGKLSKQIAADLGTSINTIKKHRIAILEKMQADSLVSLVRMMDRLDLAQTEFDEVPHASEKRTEPLRCLVVEDQPELRSAMIEALSKQGLDVISLPDGEAIELVLEKTHIDVVLLDILLGQDKTDGLSIAQTVREKYACGIIITTAIAEQSKQLEALLESADAYLTKPIDFDMLHAVIQSVARRINA